MGRDAILLASTLILIVLIGVALSVRTILGPNIILDGTDDFFHIENIYNVTQYGFGTAHLQPTAFSTAYLWVAIPAAFALLFGLNVVTESLLSVICLAGATVVVFLIGKELKDSVSGLVSALTFVLVPIVAAQGASAGNNMAVTFFMSLAVLLFLLGLKGTKGKYFAASGFVGFAGALASSAESLLIFVFLVPALLFLILMKEDKKLRVNALFFFAGILLAVIATIVVGLMLTSNPFGYFTYSLGNGSYPPSPEPEIAPILGSFFPTNNSFIINSARASLNLYSFYDINNVPILFGFFGYATLICAAYLLLRKRHYVFFPLAWLVVLLLWLIFGKVNTSLSGYIAFHLRFMTVLAPPIALIVGLTIGDVLDSEAKVLMSHKKPQRAWFSVAVLVIVGLAYAFLAFNALSMMYLTNLANTMKNYQQAQTASFLETLPKGANIYAVAGFFNATSNSSPIRINVFGENTTNRFLSILTYINAISIDAYTGYRPAVNFSATPYKCSNLPPGYMIGIESVAYKNNAVYCSSITPLFSPSLNKTRIGIAYTVFQNITVYKVS